MGRRLIPLLFVAAVLILAVAIPSQARTDMPDVQQQATAVPTTAGATSNVTIFFIACNDRAVLNFSGTMQTGYDVYYVVSAGGVALTSLRRVQVSGAFQVSDTATFASGQALAAGASASVQVSIARETNSSSTLFQTTVNDVNDGCNSPQFAPATSIDSSSVGAFPNPGGTAVPFETLPSGVGSGIFSPFGGYINPTYVQQPQVNVGPRDAASLTLRSSTPGLIFAECNDSYPAAYPGVLYDSDNIIIFWSWFTRTQEQMQQHIDHAQYSVTLNNATFPFVDRMAPQLIDGNYWTFYVVRIGSLQAGYYGVAYRLTWDTLVNDGYDDYGPGSENEELAAQCDFRILPNPFGISAPVDRSYSPWVTPNGNQPPITR